MTIVVIYFGIGSDIPTSAHGPLFVAIKIITLELVPAQFAWRVLLYQYVMVCYV